MSAALELRAEFADPGYQDDKKPRYPIGDPDHVRAAWSYINQADNAKFYTSEQLDKVKAAIKAAAERFGIEIAEDRSYSAGEHPHVGAGSPAGGQFAPKSGGNKAPAKAPAKKPAAHHGGHGSSGTSGSGTLAYDAKTGRGPGYGMANGDPRVHSLQKDLNRLGLTDGDGKPLKDDGKLGPKTTAAVKKAQKTLGLKQDGIVTPALLEKLKAAKPMKAKRSVDLCVRSFGFELESRGDGRTLEGYAAVFNSPTKIRDLQGDFEETILPGAFTRSIRQRMPILQWDHGKDPRVGTVPIGSIERLAEDTRGLHVQARLFDNPVVEPVRQAIEGGAVKGMSFRFEVPAKGDSWTRAGGMDQRAIGDADVHELGPVAFPAYDNTSVSVRTLLAQLDAAEIRSLVYELAEHLGLAVDLTDLVGQSVARSADGDEHDAEPEGEAPNQSPEELRLQEQALRALGVL